MMPTTYYNHKATLELAEPDLQVDARAGIAGSKGSKEMKVDLAKVFPREKMGHIRVEGVADVAGFATQQAAPGENVKVLTSAALTSDHSEFYVYIEQIPKLVSAPGIFIQWDGVYQFLAVLHAEGSADLYLNGFPTAIEIQARRDIEAGEAVSEGDIGDVRRLKFPGIPIGESDRVIYCFKCGWKFGLFFDLDRRDRPLDVDAMSLALGSLFRYLKYQYVYNVLENRPQFERLMKEGWFPFVELLGNRYRALLRAYRRAPAAQAEIDKVVSTVDEKACERMKQRWWKHPVLAEKRTILEAGMNAFLRGDAEGAIHAIKTFLPEIEGVLRILYFRETGRGDQVRTPDLITHIIEKGRTKGGSEYSLLLPGSFLEYLRDVFFANFNLETGEIALSRHTAAHGVARPEEYTSARALQAVLVLDQIVTYL